MTNWLKIIDDNEEALINALDEAQISAFNHGVEALAGREPNSEMVEEVLLHDDGHIEIITREENITDADVFNGKAISAGVYPHWTSDSFDLLLTEEELEELEKNPEKWAEVANDVELNRDDILAEYDVLKNLETLRREYYAE